MKVAITGASGFIGGAFVRALRSTMPEVDVVALASSTSSVEGIRSKWPDMEVAPLRRGDASVNEEALRGVNVLVHAAWSTVPSTAARDPKADLEQNVEFGLGLMDAAGRAGIGRFVFLSSGGTVYGDPLVLPIDEAHPTRPVTAYGASKLCFEQYLRTRAAHHGFEQVVLRPSNVYGNEAGATKPQGVIEHWITCIATGRPIAVWNGLEVRRDYLHVDDLVDVLLHALTAPVAGRTLNIGTGVGTSLAELLELLEQITGKEVQVHHRGTSPNGSPANVLDALACRKLLSWEPLVSLPVGVERLWSVLRNT